VSERITLDADRATALDEALEKRRDYIAAEAISLLIDGEDSVHYPGCPECDGPAEHVEWSTYDQGTGGLLEINVGPCGHRFSISPVPSRFDPDGFWQPTA
jgi:hypothetical protein